MQNITLNNENTVESVQPQSTDCLADDTLQQLKMAGQVQRNFLPSQLPENPRLKFATVFQPADYVSGDIYDIARLDEQHIGFYIADAVGHSMPAALLTMFLKQALVMRQTDKNDYRIFSPMEVMTKLNQKMEAQLNGALFATCCYCLLNTKTLTMTFARAGHPYPLLIQPGAEPIQLEGRGSLLGVFPEAQFTQETVQLTPGDKIFLYSDGGEHLIGETQDDSTFKFQQEFLAIKDLSADEMLGRFSTIAKNHPLPKEQFDDITAIALEIL